MSVSQVTVFVFSEDGTQQSGPHIALSLESSSTYNPIYSLKLRLASQTTKSSLLYVVMTTVDDISILTSSDNKLESSILAVAVFPVFLDKKNKTPASEKTFEVLLHAGNYSIPLYFAQYSQYSPADLLKMQVE